MKRSGILLATSITLLAGCASQSAVNSARDEIDSVKTRLFTVERDMKNIRDESRTVLGDLEKNFKSDVAAVRKLSADIQATIDSTKTDMQALNGKLDDMGIALKKPAEDLDRYRSDADKRIIALEDRILKQQSLLDELGKKLTELSLAKKEAPAAAPVTPDALYMKGLDTFKAGDMPAAREIFSKFLEQNPQHDLAANAHYWIGETLYSEKNYESAILAFQEVIKNYPQKEKVPAAMLKQAMAFNSINDGKSARYVLKKLIEGYPKSDESRNAREFLKEIK